MWKRDCEGGGSQIEDVPKLQPLSYTEFEVFLSLKFELSGIQMLNLR